MAMIIALSGKARAGKDTAFVFFSYNGFVRMALADPLKELCRKMFHLSKDQTDGALKEVADSRYSRTPRSILIKVGNDMREIYENVWIEQLLVKIKSLPSDAKIVITDLRYKNEAIVLKKAGAILCRLERHPSRDNMVSEETKLSKSETDLDDYKEWDFTIPAELNETPQSLEKWVQGIMDKLGAKK